MTETASNAPQRRADQLLSLLAERLGAQLATSTAAVGYIELKEGTSRFVPVVHPGRMAALVLAAGLGMLAILRAGTAPRARSRLPWR